MKEFDITYYYGPTGEYIQNDRFLTDIAQCGFTSVPVDDGNPADNRAALAALERHGLKASSVFDRRFRQLLGKKPELTDEEATRVIGEILHDHAGCAPFESWCICDEPRPWEFPNLAKIVSTLRRLDPAHETTINLLPNYGVSEVLKHPYQSYGAEEEAVYADYLDRFCREVRPHYLSYDNYHFFAGERTPRTEFFSNLESIRAYSLQYDLDAMQIVLLSQHYHYADVTAAQLCFEVNHSLVYGMKRLSYFTYWRSPDMLADENQWYRNACVDSDGTRHHHYYDVQAISRWLLPLGRELFGKRSTAVFHLTEEGETLPYLCKPYTAFGGLGRISGANAVIGFFDDGSFMTVSKQYREEAASDVTLTLEDFAGALEYFDPATAAWRAAEACPRIGHANGKYTLTLPAAGSLLLRAK